MAETKIRVGVIGANAQYGWGMRAHLPALLALPEYELTAVCTAHPETAEESAKQYGARLAFHDYQEMVQHPEIDLVSVAVKAPMHYDMVMATLGAGKHIYCEWPLGANLDEAEEMAALANDKGVKHMVGLQARCDPALLRLQELLSEEYLGEVLSCPRPPWSRMWAYCTISREEATMDPSLPYTSIRQPEPCHGTVDTCTDATAPLVKTPLTSTLSAAVTLTILPGSEVSHSETWVATWAETS